MPRQRIHNGRNYSLIPMREPDGTIKRDADGKPSGRWYKTDWVDSAESERLSEGFEPGDFLFNDHEPNVVIMWDKRRADSQTGEVGDQGFVHLALEVTPEWMREQLRAYDLQLAASKEGNGVFAPEPNITLGAGALTWQDLNVLAKTARQARDDAFGKPE
jgi:hypothetical protein